MFLPAFHSWHWQIEAFLTLQIKLGIAPCRFSGWQLEKLGVKLSCGENMRWKRRRRRGNRNTWYDTDIGHWTSGIRPIWRSGFFVHQSPVYSKRRLAIDAAGLWTCHLWLSFFWNGSFVFIWIACSCSPVFSCIPIIPDRFSVRFGSNHQQCLS